MKKYLKNQDWVCIIMLALASLIIGIVLNVVAPSINAWSSDCRMGKGEYCL